MSADSRNFRHRDQGIPRLFDRARRAAARPASWVILFFAAVFLIAGMVLGTGALTAIAQLARSSVTEAAAPSLQPYLVRLAEPNRTVLVNAPVSQLNAEARQESRDAVSAVLTELAASGEASQATYDDARFAFHVRLTDGAKSKLAANELVAGIDPDETANVGVPTVRPGDSGSDISSVDYVQVYSPFMWGKVNYGGLSVTATLYQSDGVTVKGEAVQVANGKSIVIDTATLYFETVFVDPNDVSHPPVMIAPNDVVKVVTSGFNPVTQQNQTTERTVPVDDVTTWTTYQDDTIHGHTSAANNSVVITVGSLGLSSYLNNSNVPLAQVTSDGSGNFSANAFAPVGSTPRTIDLQQGATGFVRVIHSDNCEVYIVHGQSIRVSENASYVDGWAFNLPGAPGGIITPGVTVTRPAPKVTLTLKNSNGNVKDVETAGPGTPYTILFAKPVASDDSVTVQINNLTLPTVPLPAITGSIDLGSDQVVGSAPPNTLLTVGVGRADGYVKSHFSSTFVTANPTSNGAGSYNTGPIKCGTSNQLTLQPGSFGYVGFEDGHGNFLYSDYAAPMTDVMVNYPFVEGWVSYGTVHPTVTVTDSNGQVKSTTLDVTPLVFLMSNPRLYLNLYYNVTPSAFINPGDTVTVKGGSRKDQVVAKSLAAYVNTDDEKVYGVVPRSATVTVVPDNARTSYNTVTADANGNIIAANPYSTFNSSNCTTGTTNLAYSPGAAGRVYLAQPDGNRVFSVWGRAMHINENENVVEFYLYPTANLDWYNPPSNNPLTVTETHDGTPVTLPPVNTNGVSGYIKDLLVNGGQKVIIRGGDSLAASYTEGPPGGPTRTTELTSGTIPLVIGIPDVDADTIGGLGGKDWSGQALLNAPPSGSPILIPGRSSPAFGPSNFFSGGKVVDLLVGNSGTVSFSDHQGNRVWSAWAATAFPVKINAPLAIGQTVVCGKASPNIGIKIFDASNQPALNEIGHGAADTKGNFCVTVSPALYQGEAVIAQDANGTYSQPVIVGSPVYLPIVHH